LLNLQTSHQSFLNSNQLTFTTQGLIHAITISNFFSLRKAFVLLFMNVFVAFGQLPDSCLSNYDKFIQTLSDEKLEGQEVVDSSSSFVNWDWRLASDENINEITSICQRRIKEAPTMESKAPFHDLLRHIYQFNGKFGKAVVQFEKLIAIYSVLNDTARALTYYHHLAWMYHRQGLLDESLITYSKVIEHEEHIENDYQRASNNWTYGYFFSVAGWELKKPEYLDSSLKYHALAYEYDLYNNGDGHVDVEWTITYAMALARHGDKKKAIEVAKVGLNWANETKDILYQSRFNKQLSQYYLSLENKDSAYYHIYECAKYEAMMYPEDHPDVVKFDNGKQRIHMFNVYFLIQVWDHFGDKEKAAALLDQILEGPNKIPDYHTRMSYRGYAAETYLKYGDYEKSASNYRLYQTYNDSLQKESIAVTKKIKAAQLESQIALEKERAAIEKQQQEELAKKEKENLRTIIYSVIAGAIIVVFFLIVVYRRFKVTAKQKNVIAEQKSMVESAYAQLGKKNKEILDSIKYATRIQNAILPSKQSMKEWLPNSFVIYLPKDIVAGDFYWLEEKEGKVLFAAADCTGHGVPGAMVSVVCNNGLNRSVREHNITKPSDILEKTREIVIQEFEKSEEEVNDGMDIALCAIDGNELQYAGAHNPLWIIRNGSDEIEEFKADKQPIGKFFFSKDYTNHITTVEKGDMIYVFTDGFADQFGGPKGKKYYGANFQKLLLTIKDLSLEEQKARIIGEFEQWKGDREQIDDVCVIGVRV
jgi:serine phosphatase RsbU (regulator of sigma subunit)